MPLTFTGPWKKKCLAGEFGIVTQCVAPSSRVRVNDQYLTNLLLKINAKVCFLFPLKFVTMVTFVYGNYIFFILFPSSIKQLGGMNSLLQIETSPAIPHVSKVPTIILGMDVLRGSPGHSDVPSIAAVSISFGICCAK
jgi:eukaryotic translation initiation factor 2C